MGVLLSSDAKSNTAICSCNIICFNFFIVELSLFLSLFVAKAYASSFFPIFFLNLVLYFISSFKGTVGRNSKATKKQLVCFLLNS